MKVKFCCNNGANIHSKRTEIFDTEKDLGFTDEGWIKMSEEDKNRIVSEWVWEHLNYWYEEV